MLENGMSELVLAKLVLANHNVTLNNKNKMENEMEFAVLNCFVIVDQHRERNT